MRSNRRVDTVMLSTLSSIRPRAFVKVIPSVFFLRNPLSSLTETARESSSPQIAGGSSPG